jgi:hypothetical protein
MEMCPTILYILYIFKWVHFHPFAYILNQIKFLFNNFNDILMLFNKIAVISI